MLAAVLGIGAGRFTVAPSLANLPSADLNGTLAEQLARPIACAREALAATTGAKTMNVDRVLLDGDAIAGYLLATPEHERILIKRIAQGDSPREMLLKGEVAPTLLEDVLADLAARGAITAVRDTRGNDVLGPAVERALNAVPRAESGPSSTRRTPSPLPSSELVARELPVISAASQARKQGAAAAPAHADRDSSPPSSLEDAVMRAMSDRSPAAGRVHSSEQPPIVEPSQLRPRSSNPPAGESGKQPTGSIPPDAVVPGNSSGDMPAARAVSPEDASVPVFVEPSERLGGEPQPSSTSQVARPVVATTSPATNQRERKWRFLAVLLPVLLVVVVGIRWVNPMRAEPFASPGGEPASIPTSSGAAPQTFTDLPSDEILPQGDGVLDLRVADNAALSVDGVEFRPPHEGGRVRLKLQAGIHEVKLSSGAQELLRVAEVRPGRATLIDLSQSP